ncbi:hypothetical protein SAMN05444280_12924 [Tangfeifania diversioriginum]|uniref:Uncharacterized protein n=1 Tax=Tangfeifania diversioriginum TaxID=1168035 RepID=A0A1M6M0F6_9BACT|nr:hypothetical protein [Tangfeifania diversioriginum]SHJ76918.1 hypothetical protein SAMN05444280_12924 [Tangfeifania diversioriginum]
MKKTELVKTEKKLISVEKQLIGELFLTRNTNDIIAFTQTYVTNYIPILYYAVKHFDTNQIARLMNSSILIDRLLSGRINDAINLQVHNDVKEFLSKNQMKDKSEVIKLINNQTIVNKANLSSTILFMFSFMRSTLFSLYCNKKLYLNYGVGWNNMLIHFVQNPHLIFLLDNKDIEKAEKELKFIKDDIALINGKLANEIKQELLENNLCTKKEFSKITIHFVGLKIDWLKSKSLLSYCKYLKTSDKRELNKSIKYSNLLLDTLENEEIDYHKFSFRKKITFPGPAPDLKEIIGDKQKYSSIIKLFNYIAYFESKDDKMVIVFPTSLEYYFNLDQTYKKNDVDVRILEDENFILEINNGGCGSIIGYLNSIVKPYESQFHRDWFPIHEILTSFKKDGISNKFIYDQLKKSEIKDQIISNFERKINKKRLLSNAMGVSFLAGINYYAEAKGFTQVPLYLSTTVPLLTEIVLKALYKSGYEEILVDLTKEDKDETNALGLSDMDDEYGSLKELEEQIENLESTSEELMDYVKMDGLKLVIDTNTKIRNLIMSSRPINEINSELKKIYESLE